MDILASLHERCRECNTNGSGEIAVQTDQPAGHAHLVSGNVAQWRQRQGGMAKSLGASAQDDTQKKQRATYDRRRTCTECAYDTPDVEKSC
jgi:hypothetical protein